MLFTWILKIKIFWNLFSLILGHQIILNFNLTLDLQLGRLSEKKTILSGQSNYMFNSKSYLANESYLAIESYLANDRWPYNVFELNI